MHWSTLEAPAVFDLDPAGQAVQIDEPGSLAKEVSSQSEQSSSPTIIEPTLQAHMS
jgi:hypothetical protein